MLDLSAGHGVADEIARGEMDIERQQRPQQREDASVHDVHSELPAVDGAEHLGGALALAIGRFRFAETIGSARVILGDMARVPRLGAVDRARATGRRSVPPVARTREIERAARARDDRVEHAARIVLVQVGARVGGGVDDIIVRSRRPARAQGRRPSRTRTPASLVRCGAFASKAAGLRVTMRTVTPRPNRRSASASASSIQRPIKPVPPVMKMRCRQLRPVALERREHRVEIVLEASSSRDPSSPSCNRRGLAGNGSGSIPQGRSWDGSRGGARAMRA